MDQRFHALPPLKRFRLMQQQEQQEDTLLSSSRLPAKKRKEAWHQPLLPDPFAATTAVSTYSLPAKKRVWAFQPDLISEDPLSTLDLNVEYKVPFGAESEEAVVEKEEEEEEKGIIHENDCSEATENTQEEKGQEITGDEDDNEEEEDGIVCAICQSTDGDASDPIVFCDGCDLMVHATCYGNPLVKGIPEGDWFCSQCSLSSASSQSTESSSCCLCPIKGGAMKHTRDGRWAHIVCALYVPEVFFKDPEGREGIDCSKVPKRRWKERCYVCKSSRGCAIQCSELKCPLAFHVTCGLNEDLCLEYREGRKQGAIVAGFCKTHSDLWKKQEQTGKYKIVARED
ncbi:PREDICTED: protein Jade-1 [Prunus mume]|uniref:Protein Jade-1 n=1 Tax=Prunus mume TaxID=102107 RepID=A0ABM0NL01_PRUMU|nr:PREDICTED: protein Jade-1 [Prunus mume]